MTDELDQQLEREFLAPTSVADYRRMKTALASARADAAQWRQRVMDTRPILNLVEDVADDPSPANVAALVDAFSAWRMCVERGVPFTWRLAGEPGAPGDETECLF